MTANAELLGLLVVHLALIGAPGVAAALFLARRGARGVHLILAGALAASGLVAFLSFWAYYASPTLGQAWDFLVVFGSIQVGALAAYRGGLDRDLLRALRTPLLLWVVGSTFIVFFGFVHGGTDEAVGMSSARFSHILPSDNDIPRFYANWFETEGHAGDPPIFPPDWQMGDRPPLQVGYLLSQRAFIGDSEDTLDSQVAAVVVQQLWIVAMWALLCAARLRPATRGLAICAAAFSDVAFVHGFFVWPKLIAATFVLAALAVVLSPGWTELRRDPRVAALLGCLLALAMLAHGSSVYGVFPLVLIAAYRGMPSWRWVGVAASVGVVLMGSWTAYQRFNDLPGDRLVKYHLAGVLHADDRGAVEAIVDGYRDAGFAETLENKWDNVAEILGGTKLRTTVRDTVDAGDVEGAVASIRYYRFFSLFPFLGVFLIAPIAMLIARNRPDRDEDEWRFALYGFAFAAIGCAFWALLQFGTPDASTAIHLGTLTLPLLLVCACVAGLRATYPRLAAGVVVFSVAVALAMYTPSFTPVDGTSYSPVAALLAALSLAAFVALAFRREPV